MKRIFMTLIAVFLLGKATVVAAPVAHMSVLTGKVSTVVPVGTAVETGQTLVTVETLAGPMAASKATVNGVVTKVDVQPGTDIARGQTVVIVESK